LRARRIGSALTEASLQGFARSNRRGPNRRRSDRSKATAPALPATTNSAGLGAATLRRDEPGITMPAILDDATRPRFDRNAGHARASPSRESSFDFTHVERLTADALALLLSLCTRSPPLRAAPVIEASGMSSGVGSILQVAGIGRRLWTGALAEDPMSQDPAFSQAFHRRSREHLAAMTSAMISLERDQGNPQPATRTVAACSAQHQGAGAGLSAGATSSALPCDGRSDRDILDGKSRTDAGCRRYASGRFWIASRDGDDLDHSDEPDISDSLRACSR